MKKIVLYQWRLRILSQVYSVSNTYMYTLAILSLSKDQKAGNAILLHSGQAKDVGHMPHPGVVPIKTLRFRFT
jgi:hypothetical protein